MTVVPDNEARARAVGLTEQQLVLLETAREDRRAGRQLTVDPVALAFALSHPGAILFDHSFVIRERARARRSSRNVAPVRVDPADQRLEATRAPNGPVPG